jgi:ATP-binding cassette, subfamily C (CFTR/MRP), member 1
LCLLLIGSEIGFLILCAQASAVTTRTSLPAAALSFAASLSLLGLSYTEHVYSYRPSTLLNLFLLFSVLFDATRTRTLWLQGYNRPLAIAALVSTVVKLVMLPVEAYEKRGFLRPQYRELPPEVTSGILSRWAFWWQLPLFRAGYSKKLEVDTLFPLEKHFKSSHLQRTLQVRWSKCMSPDIK